MMERVEWGDHDMGGSFTKYNQNDPFDMAAMIINCLDDLRDDKILRVINHVPKKYLTADGEEFRKCLFLLCGYIATNKGIGQDNYDRYKRYHEWLQNHQHDIPELLTRALANNKELYEQEANK